MPRYYFHVCNGEGFTEDEEGLELRDEAAARKTAIKEARALMADELRDGQLNLASFIEVEDEKRERLFTLTFEEAVAINRQPAVQV